MSEPKEYPILFSGEMVRAILEGRKTQTRRPVKFAEPFSRHSAWPYCYSTNDGGWMWFSSSINGRFLEERRNDEGRQCPYGLVGDRLWVQEAYAITSYETDGILGEVSASGYCAADLECFHDVPLSGRETVKFLARKHPFRLQPARHMYRSLSRILLEITDVRPQRLQDITEEDAIAEGVGPGFVTCLHPEFPDLPTTRCVGHRPMFFRLWDEIYSKRGFGWDVNPWVWAITFKIMEVKR
jgi:hypothetical protein